MSDLKKTALTHVHEALGAKMVPFAGYNMPVQYTGVIDEHTNVRKNVGMFDVSHMGEFLVRGHRRRCLPVARGYLALCARGRVELDQPADPGAA